MPNNKDHSYSLTRGLGGMFIFACFQFLENNLFITALVMLAIGAISMLPHPWKKRWTAITLYGINAIASAVVFYEFIQLGFQYIQWLWLAVFIYYIIRLRDKLRKETMANEPTQVTEKTDPQLNTKTPSL